MFWLIGFGIGLVVVWLVVGLFLAMDCEDLPFAWPYFALKYLVVKLPVIRTHNTIKEAYKQGRYDMDHYGSINNPGNGRRTKKYMASKNEKVYDAYIKGGHEILAEAAEEAAGISLHQLRVLSLEKSDKARLEKVQAMKEARKEMLTPPEDKWQKEFEGIAR